MSVLHFSGSRVRKARLRKDWSQADLARALSTNEKNVSRWENGDHKPGADSVAAIARATGHDIGFFYVEADADADEEGELERVAATLAGTLVTEIRRAAREVPA